jgi:hypothetical protein
MTTTTAAAAPGMLMVSNDTSQRMVFIITVTPNASFPDTPSVYSLFHDGYGLSLKNVYMYMPSWQTVK